MPEWVFWLAVTGALIGVALLTSLTADVVQRVRRKRFMRYWIESGMTPGEAERAADLMGL